MKIWIVIWYLALVLVSTLLPQCNAAGGGSDANSKAAVTSGSTLLSLMVTNNFMYKLTRGFRTNPANEVVQEWVEKLSEKLQVGIRYTQRLHKVFVNRAWHICKTVRALKHGREQRKFLEKDWTFTIQPDELSVTLLQKENEALTQKLADSTERCRSLGETNKHLNTLLMSASDKLKKVSDAHTPPSVQSSTPRDYSASHSRRLKRQRVHDCELSLAWLEQYGYSATKVEAINKRTGAVEVINLTENERDAIFGTDSASMAEEDLQMINMILFVKDRFQISGEAYHEMTKICKALPRSYLIKQRIAELNRLWNIRPTPSGSEGVQQSLKDRLATRISCLIDKGPQDAPFLVNKKVRVKLSGDGTRIGKRLHVVNFTFTLLDEGDTAYSSEGNHPLAIFKDPENYDSLARALSDIRNDVATLTEITVRETTFTIEYFLGGDMKFLAIVTGIDSASSTYSCVWCKCPAASRFDAAMQWSLTDTSKGARTTKENTELAKLPKSKRKFNVSNEPLFPTIAIDHVVIDNLHLFLRISDTLINLLITDLKRAEAIDKVNKFTTFSVERYYHLKKYEEFISSLGIPSFQFYIGQSSKQLKCRSLTGPEKLKLFKHIDVPMLLPNKPSSETQRIQSLWSKFYELNTRLSKKPEELTNEDMSEFGLLAKNWVRGFTNVYHGDKVTPYMHSMMFHVPDFFQLHGSLLPFTQQGLEKYNDCMTKIYFRSTSHRGEEALKQIMEKQNRLEHLRDADARPAKRFVVRCSNCNEGGHNMLTCLKPCRSCEFSPFRAHLVLKDGKKVPTCRLDTTTTIEQAE